MPIVSYAQNREDVILNRVFPGDAGFYIDVGAALPVDLSVTKLFYDRGWSGINVEPQDGFFRALVDDRPRDVNLQAVLSDRPGTLTLFESPTQAGMTTVNADAARHIENSGHTVIRREVPALTLAEVCEKHVTGEIDFLKIDVEGEERNVLLGADFSRWRPRVLVIEATEQGGPTPNHHLWEDVVLAADYKFAAFDGLNRYYVRAGDEALIEPLQRPVSVFDDFVPYEVAQWQAVAERSERNLGVVHAECERVRAAYAALSADYDALDARSKDYWNKHVESYQLFEAAQRRFEAAHQRAAEMEWHFRETERRLKDTEQLYQDAESRYQDAEQRFGDARQKYEAVRDQLAAVKQVLGRLRGDIRQPVGR